MPALATLGALLLTAAPAAVAVRPGAGQSIVELQARFDGEKNAERKAKLLAKLGDALFSESRRAAKARDYSSSVLFLERYRDNVRAAMGELFRQYPDAEKKSSGYRVLEVDVREGIREVEDALDSVPEVYRPPLRIVRDDLQGYEDQLLRRLFPRRPGEKKRPAGARSKGDPA